MLNSFWGKFGQRENLPQTEQCTNPDQLYKLLDDDTLEVQNIRFCTEDVIEVVYAYKEEAIVPNNRTNVFIAAFTTCWRWSSNRPKPTTSQTQKPISLSPGKSTWTVWTRQPRADRGIAVQTAANINAIKRMEPTRPMRYESEQWYKRLTA